MSTGRQWFCFFSVKEVSVFNTDLICSCFSIHCISGAASVGFDGSLDIQPRLRDCIVFMRASCQSIRRAVVLLVHVRGRFPCVRRSELCP